VPARHIAIVGAGVAGLAAAVELAGDSEVTVVDRLPVAGGVLGYESTPVRELKRRCDGVKVNWLLGTTAVRWQSRRLLTAGPAGIKWLPADRLIYAGGSRPAHQAELRIAGPRLAGVLPAPVAVHFAEAKVHLGRRVTIIGTGNWAQAAAEQITGQDCHITVVGQGGDAAPSFRHEAFIEGWTPVSVAGTGRVSALLRERDGHRHRILCDAVILGTASRPLRNVDGAITEPSELVTFVQPIAEHATHDWVAREARRSASGFSDSQIEEVLV
jgi:cation diffusion facilitator CzcD-associated flavoprotein CzcO